MKYKFLFIFTSSLLLLVTAGPIFAASDLEPLFVYPPTSSSNNLIIQESHRETALSNQRRRPHHLQAHM
jgi:hypothetical protein